MDMRKTFHTLKPRERGAVLFVVSLVMVFLWDRMVWSAHAKQMVYHEQNLENARAEEKKLSARLQEIQTLASSDPNVANQRKKAELEKQVVDLDRQLGREAATLMPTAQVVETMKTLFAQRPNIKLMSMDAWDVQPITLTMLDNTHKAVADEAPLFYRHNFKMTFNARYLDALRLVEEIEKLPWVLFWDGLRYEATTYPAAATHLYLYSLSVGEGLFGG